MSRGEMFPIINCVDILRTRAFYVAVFEGEQTYQFPADGDPIYLTLTVGSGTVALGVGTDTALYGEIPLPATGHAMELCIYADDLDAVVADALQQAGAVVVQPSMMPWGERIAYLRDPEGTMLLVIQSDGDAIA